MSTILLTGATDGIGLKAAERLVAGGHTVLLHGRNPEKLARVGERLGQPTYQADLSDLSQVDALADAVAADHPKLDVLINNAGVFKTSRPLTSDGLDVRFVVNTLAPVRLTHKLLPVLKNGRILNLSSAAQNPVDLDALAGRKRLDEFGAYAQSKLALTMWSAWLAQDLGSDAVVLAINPGSLLDTKMVREGFGRTRGTADVGAQVLERLAITDEGTTGSYFDNDAGRFGPPHPLAEDPEACATVVDALQDQIERLVG